MTKTYVGTRSYHYFEHIGNGKIGAKILSSDEQFEKKAHHAPLLCHSMNDLHVNSYLAFVFDKKWYVGIINDVDLEECEIEVSSMHPAGPARTFFWPARVDEVWVHSGQVLCIIDSPDMRSSRGHYALSAKATSDIAQAWSVHTS